jgi:hypothetical protein
MIEATQAYHPKVLNTIRIIADRLLRPPHRRGFRDTRDVPRLRPELAKPPICQIDLYLRAQPPLRANCKHVSHNQIRTGSIEGRLVCE